MNGEVHLVAFRLGRKRYALDGAAVQRVVRAVTLTPLPGAPAASFSAPQNSGSILSRQVSKSEDPTGKAVIPRVEIRKRNAERPGKPFGSEKIGGVLASLVLVYARTGGKLIDSRPDTQLFLGKTSLQSRLANAFSDDHTTAIDLQGLSPIQAGSSESHASVIPFALTRY